MLGTYALSAGYYDAFYLKAQQVRTLIRRDFERAFERRRRDRAADEPDAGVPARRAARPIRCRCTWRMSLRWARRWRACRRSACPCGLTPASCPSVFRFTGRAWDDATVYQIAAAFERIAAGAAPRR